MTNARTFLYVPGDRPQRFGKALSSGTDVVILDLEDAVLAGRKEQARHEVISWLGANPHRPVKVLVRINAGALGAVDATAIGDRADGLVVPKASVAEIDDIGQRTTRPLCALVETPQGIIEVRQLAQHRRVSSVAIGEVDLAVELGIDPSPDRRELAPYRAALVLACAGAGVMPIGPAYVDVNDLDGLRAETEALRRAGFSARQVIHPKQVQVVHEALTPPPEVMAWAQRTLRTAASQGASTDESGAMVDEAVLRRARSILQQARPLPPEA